MDAGRRTAAQRKGQKTSFAERERHGVRFMKKTVLITGGAGFIGGNFVYYMLDAHPDYDLVCVDSLTYAVIFRRSKKQ